MYINDIIQFAIHIITDINHYDGVMKLYIKQIMLKIIIHSFIVKKIFQISYFEKNYEKKYYGHNFILVSSKKSISFILLAHIVSRNFNFDRSRRSKIRGRQNDAKSRVRKMGARGAD